MTQSEENTNEEFANGTTDVPDAAPHLTNGVVVPDEKKVKPKSIKDTISEELERIGLGGKWVW